MGRPTERYRQRSPDSGKEVEQILARGPVLGEEIDREVIFLLDNATKSVYTLYQSLGSKQKTQMFTSTETLISSHPRSVAASQWFILGYAQDNTQ